MIRPLWVVAAASFVAGCTQTAAIDAAPGPAVLLALCMAVVGAACVALGGDA